MSPKPLIYRYQVDDNIDEICDNNIGSVYKNINNIKKLFKFTNKYEYEPEFTEWTKITEFYDIEEYLFCMCHYNNIELYK